MWMMLISFVLLFISSFSLLFNQPILLGFILIMSSMLVCFFIAAEISSVLGFMVFLTYVSGVMVLFLYVLSIYPNEAFYMKISITLVACLLVVSLGTYLNRDCGVFLEKSDSLWLSFMSSGVHWQIYLFMAFILLYVMVIVSYLCMKKMAPLRSLS
uniref:NADH dehydrogenase subunit 6 n=1 Tax=Gregariella coralliophaga TaxID=2590089 RepID=A0A516EZG4_9BIVA|nr:NADH dehydrogenase subunit 6 [Gregariella coralliophaga]QDO71900.1 NADH dehydrogenase subunit 6 [Gregariella coralliophaga]